MEIYIEKTPEVKKLLVNHGYRYTENYPEEPVFMIVLDADAELYAYTAFKVGVPMVGIDELSACLLITDRKVRKEYIDSLINKE